MKADEPGLSVNDHLTGQVDDEAANDDVYETDVERASAAYYARSKTMWANFNRGDCWIAVGLYLIMASVAFVAL